MFPPDDGATGQLLAELAGALAKEGWRVTVLAGGTLNFEPRTLNFELHRVAGLPFTRASFVRRAFSYASLYPALLWRALRLPRHDVVVTLTDPPLLLLIAPLIKLFKRARCVHWAQDVYPEVAEELGVLRRGGLAASLLRRLSTWALRHHDSIIAVGGCMKARLVARGIAAEKIFVIPNWAVGASGSHLSPLPSHLPFTVMYSGNLGLAHPFEAIIDAVKILERERAPVRFVFAGTGARLDSVREELRSCSNLEFRAPVPLENLLASLASADAHLACMKDELCGLVVPSKVYGVLAAGRPCVFLGPGASEAAQLIARSGAGAVLSAANDGHALADLIRSWSARGAEYQHARAASERLAAESSGVPPRAFASVLNPRGARE